MNDVALRNLPLAKHMAAAFARRCRLCPFDADDCHQEAALACVLASRRFGLTDGPVNEAAYFAVSIRQALRLWFVRRPVVRRSVRDAKTFGLAPPVLPLPRDVVRRCSSSRWTPDVGAALGTLRPAERAFLARRYGLDGGDGVTQRVAAREVGVTRQAVTCREQGILRRLRGYVEQYA